MVAYFRAGRKALPDFCIICPLTAIIFVIAGTLLAIRDIRQQRKQPPRPIAEQIQTIHAHAEFQVAELQRYLDSARASSAKEHHRATFQAFIDFYRRMEAIAASTTPSAEEAEKLAEEAEQYSREQRTKGFFVASNARRLATLIRNRPQGE